MPVNVARMRRISPVYDRAYREAEATAKEQARIRREVAAHARKLKKLEAQDRRREKKAKRRKKKSRLLSWIF
jgi:hypothetical protein